MQSYLNNTIKNGNKTSPNEARIAGRHVSLTLLLCRNIRIALHILIMDSKS